MHPMWVSRARELFSYSILLARDYGTTPDLTGIGALKTCSIKGLEDLDDARLRQVAAAENAIRTVPAKSPEGAYQLTGQLRRTCAIPPEWSLLLTFYRNEA